MKITPQKAAEELVIKLDASAVHEAAREALEKTFGSAPAVYQEGALLLDLLVSGGIHKIGELVRAEATVRSMLETIAVSHRLVGELREQNEAFQALKSVGIDAAGTLREMCVAYLVRAETAEVVEREACVRAVEATPLKAHSTIGQREACVAAILARPVTGNIVLSDVLRECRRQVDKGYTAEHDDTHTACEIVASSRWGALSRLNKAVSGTADCPEYRRLLVQAAALILKEIERLDRAETKS